MPHPNYVKGVRKERKLVNQARALGHISFRSAGSHSPIDVIIIEPKTHNIRLIQCKPEGFAGREKLLFQNGYLSGTYEVEYEVI